MSACDGLTVAQCNRVAAGIQRMLDLTDALRQRRILEVQQRSDRDAGLNGEANRRHQHESSADALAGKTYSSRSRANFLARFSVAIWNWPFAGLFRRIAGCLFDCGAGAAQSAWTPPFGLWKISGSCGRQGDAQGRTAILQGADWRSNVRRRQSTHGRGAEAETR